jgi:hypothetical protein
MPDAPKVGLLNKKIGGIQTKWWVLGGLGMGGVAYYIYKRESSTTAAPTSSSDATNADNSDIDPSTGVPYSEEDQGSDYTDTDSGYDDSYGDQYGGNGVADDAGEYFNEGLEAGEASSAVATTAASTASTTGGGHATDRHWLTEAVDKLVASGHSRATVTAALAGYLAGAPLTQKQIDIVESAIAAEGRPPHSPPPIHQIPNPKASKTIPARKPVKKTTAPKPKLPIKLPRHNTGK